MMYKQLLFINISAYLFLQLKYIEYLVSTYKIIFIHLYNEIIIYISHGIYRLVFHTI